MINFMLLKDPQEVDGRSVLVEVTEPPKPVQTTMSERLDVEIAPHLTIHLRITLKRLGRKKCGVCFLWRICYSLVEDSSAIQSVKFCAKCAGLR